MTLNDLDPHLSSIFMAVEGKAAVSSKSGLANLSNLNSWQDKILSGSRCPHLRRMCAIIQSEQSLLKSITLDQDLQDQLLLDNIPSLYPITIQRCKCSYFQPNLLGAFVLQNTFEEPSQFNLNYTPVSSYIPPDQRPYEKKLSKVLTPIFRIHINCRCIFIY